MLISSQSGFAQNDSSDFENAKLEAWLSDRGLDDLLLEQLESRLESTTESSARQQVAAKLANLYRKKLLSLDGDPLPLLKRTRALIAIYPRFETGRLRVAMLHASYLAAENRFRDWIRDGALLSERAAVLKLLTSMHADLVSALAAFEDELQDLSLVAELRRDRQQIDSRQKELDIEILHCQFLAGWANYFLAVLQPEQRNDCLERSNQCFREFLQLDQATPLVDFDSRWFDFSSAWHVRAMAGLAAVAVSQGQPKNADHLYSLIRANAVSRESRESVVRFRLLAFAYSDRFQQALELLSPQQQRTLSRQSRLRLYVSAAEISRMETAPQTIAKKLNQLALVGLAREMAAELLESQMKTSKFELGDSFEAFWIRGYQHFCDAGSGDPLVLQRANDDLEKAISLAENNGVQAFASELSDVERCRFLLAWVKLKRGDIDDAINSFSVVADKLATVDPARASESAWMAAKTIARVGLRDSSRASQAWERLDRFVRRWPESPHVAEANFAKVKFELRAMRPVDAIGRLRDFPTDSDVYVASLVESVTQHYRLWQENPTDDTLQQLEQSSDTVIQSARSTSEQQLRARFLVLDALSRSASQDQSRIDPYIEDCQRLLDQVADNRTLAVELLYYRMKLADQRNDAAAVDALAREIVDSETRSRFEMPALIQLAKSYEAKGLSGDSVDENSQRAAMKVYQRLSQLLGNEDQSLRSSGNARVAFARLGELQIELNMTVQSEQIFQRLVDLFPDNGKYLRNLATSLTTNGRIDNAGRIWKKLAAGSEAGSDLWYESKLQLANSIGVKNKSAALNLLKQTVQLGGDLPTVWQQKYESAINQLQSGVR